MNKSDLPAFQRLITVLAMTFGVASDEALYAGYKLGLEDLSIADIERAVGLSLKQCRFMPKPAELRELIAPNLEAAAIVAWSVADQAVRHHGPYRSVDFEDQVINAVIRDFGGWVKYCEIPEGEYFKFTRREFERRYVSYSRSGVPAERRAALSGEFAMENTLHGYMEAISQPVLVQHPNGFEPPLERIGVAVTPRIDFKPKQIDDFDNHPNPGA